MFLRNQGRRDELGGARLELDHQLGHVLNVCLFRFIQGLEGLEIDPGARQGIRKLERTLARAEAGSDYLEMITGR